MEQVLKFGGKEIIVTIITVAVGVILTLSFGWMISMVITTIMAFFLFKLVNIEGQMSEPTIGVEELCSTCGGRLTWAQEHSRYYCYQCQKYPPLCPSCGKDLFWITQYSRLYCNDCQKYVEPEEEKRGKQGKN